LQDTRNDLRKHERWHDRSFKRARLLNAYIQREGKGAAARQGKFKRLDKGLRFVERARQRMSAL
jgi:hypothetical protein